MLEPGIIMRRLIEAFAGHDEPLLRSLLGENVVAYVTNAEGGVDRVEGRDTYAERLFSLVAPELSVEVTQSVTVAADQGLTMVKINAERKGRTLQNFAAFLGRIADDQIVELWMVEALPAYSDEFWK